MLNKIGLKELKKETLEEVAEEYCKEVFSTGMIHGASNHARQAFIQGAKWQSKRMYSDKEVEYLLHKYMQSQIPDWHGYSTAKWFEQNKKTLKDT